jgi:hypothetical protein
MKRWHWEMSSHGRYQGQDSDRPIHAVAWPHTMFAFDE